MSQLKVVQKFRHDVLDDKVHDMNEATVLLERGLKELQDMESSRGSNKAALCRRQGCGTPVESLKMYYDYDEHLKSVIEKQQEMVANLKALLEDKRNEVTEAARESKIMDKAVTRMEINKIREESKKEQKFQNEVGTTRFVRRQR